MEITRRVAKLATRGHGSSEIEDRIPGLALVASEANHVPTTDPSNVDLTDLDVYYPRGCKCWVFDASWRHDPDLDEGVDVVGITVGEEVYQLGGTRAVCDFEDDECEYGEVTRASPRGVAHEFDSEEGDYGTITMSARDYSDGNCGQMIAHYGHGWEGSRPTGYALGASDGSIVREDGSRTWERHETGGRGC